MPNYNKTPLKDKSFLTSDSNEIANGSPDIQIEDLNIDLKFLNFIERFVYLVKSLPPGHQIIAPGGWLRHDSNHLLLYVLKRSNDGDSFTFTVLNTGCPGDNSGMEYHPATFNKLTGKLERNMSLSIVNVSEDRVQDSR